MVPKPVRVMLYVTLICSFVYFLTETSVYKADLLTRSRFYRAMRRRLNSTSIDYTMSSDSNQPSPMLASAPGLSNVDGNRTTNGKNNVEGKTKNKSQIPVVTSTMAASSVIKLPTTPSISKTSSKPAMTTSPALISTTTEEPEIPGSCPKTPPGLVGKVVPRMEIVEWPVLEERHPELSAGGRWQPKDCHARHKVAIIIPYRQRFEHLHIFMNNMHNFLQKQQLDYGIYVVEQAGTAPFNRAMLLNVGYKEAMKDYKWQCIALHDVDHIPLNDHNFYACPHLPRHLSVAVERFRFRMPYRNFFGGVSLMKSEHYERINGMSNVYWGWGAEDDDLFYRCRMMGLLPIQRYPPNIGRYATIQKYHHRAPSNNNRMKLLGAWGKRQKSDGLSNLNYTVLKKQYKNLYTDILVNIGRMYR